MCLLALFFHRSAIILFAIPLIANIKLSKKSFEIALIIGLVLFILVRIDLMNINSIVINVLNFIFENDKGAINRIELYSHSTTEISIFYTIEYYLIAVLLLLNFEKLYNFDKNSKLFTNLFIGMLPLFTVFSSFSMVTRFKDYFFLCYPILISYIARFSKKNKLLIYTIVIIICFYGYMRYIIKFDGGSLIPYSSFIFENISIIE